MTTTRDIGADKPFYSDKTYRELCEARFKQAVFPCYLVFYGSSKNSITSHNRHTYAERVEFTEAEDDFEAVEKLLAFWEAYGGHGSSITIMCYPKLQSIEL